MKTKRVAALRRSLAINRMRDVNGCINVKISLAIKNASMKFLYYYKQNNIFID